MERDSAVVAVIGVGRIGQAVLETVARAGYCVRAFDIRAEVEPQVRAAGAEWPGTREGAVEHADVVLTVLPGSPELRDAMLGTPASPALLDQLSSGTDWLDLTSAAPDLGRTLAARATQRGVPYLECPVGGGVPAAHRGELTLFTAGAREVFDRRRDLLKTIGSEDRLRYLGGHGRGYLTKLLVNLLWFGQAAATAEALLLGQAAGLDPAELAAVLANGPASSEYIRSDLPSVLAGDYLASFGLDRCVEELDSLVRLAHGSGTPFELSSAVAAIHRAALDRFGPVDGELLAVAHLEQLAGRTLAAEQR